MTSFSVAIHLTESGTVVAICDLDLLGKRLKCEGHDFFVDPAFYGGRKMTADMLVSVIQGAHVVNILGKAAIQECVSRHIIKSDWVKVICGIPHVQLLLSL